MEFTYRDIPCEVHVNPGLGNWVGYAYFDRSYWVYGVRYAKLDGIECHGGVTFAASDGDLWKVGIDFAHSGDWYEHMGHLPGKHWTEDEVVEEVKHMVDSILSITRSDVDGTL